jgi:hypothetical protein
VSVLAVTMANRDVAIPIAATSAGSVPEAAAATSPASANAARDASTLINPPADNTDASATPTRVCLHIVSKRIRTWVESSRWRAPV